MTKRGKGIRKRATTFFTKHHRLYHPRQSSGDVEATKSTMYKRPTLDELRMAFKVGENGDISKPTEIQILEQQRTVMILRPKHSTENKAKETAGIEAIGNRIFNIEKLMEWFHISFWDHFDMSGGCRGQL